MRSLTRSFLFLVLLAGVPSGVIASDNAQVKSAFAEAVKAYHAAQYAQAVKLNDGIVAQGYYSSAVYYNLGNAHFKLGHLGLAILNYARAQALAPRDSDVRANLSFARSMVQNYMPWSYNPLFAPPQRFFSSRELMWVAFGVFALTGVFLLAGLYGRLRRKRLLLGAVCGYLLTAYIVVAGTAQTVHRAGMGVCVKKEDARFEPNAKATVYFKVPEGTEVKVLRAKDDWLKVERSDNKIGWVPSASIERM